MRKLMWFTIGFTSACALSVYLLGGIWPALLGMICLITAALLCVCSSQRAKITAILAFGMSAAFFWSWGYDALYLSPVRQMDAQTVDISITATDYSYENDYGAAGDGTININGKSYKVRYYLNAFDAICPGDVIEGQFRLRYTASGGSRTPTYHRSEGIYFLAYSADDYTVKAEPDVPAKYFAAQLRKNITTVLDTVFPEDTLAFARALLLGDSSLLSYEMDTAFSVSGIRHVIAVSGLHVSILFSLVYLFVGERRIITPIVGTVVLFAFAAVAGFTPSVVRACIMQELMLLALLLNKEYDPPTALSVAVLGMLIVNPLSVTSVSLQLSAGCMVGIFLFTRRIHEYLLSDKRLGPAKGKSLKARLIRWFAGSVSVTLGAMITTTPLCALYFGAVSLVGILTNLLTLWVISFIFYGIMASCVLGSFWVTGGRILAWLISWPIRYVMGMANFLSSFPLAAVYTCSIYIVLWLIFCYILLAVFLLQKKKYPGILGMCVVLGLLAAVSASWLEPAMSSFRISALDVGQGQCILLQNSDAYYLVDCGGDYDEGAADTAAQVLLSQGINRLDGVIVTHYDDDHAGGVGYLLTRIEANVLYLPNVEDERGIRQELEELYSDKIIWIEPDSTYHMKEDPITVYGAEAGKTDNESSLCILFQPENCDILITGDRSSSGERKLLKFADLPDLEILVVGHHGAKSSTSLELLKETAPDIAIISVGENNSYKHPSQGVLERLALFGVRVYRTDQLGTITFRG